ncbi:MAG: ABC transporter permease [Butyrivibrio sp.]|nr:ABC transporter permease [Butyrivibrio sp.]
MNIVSTLTLRHLQENKKRTIVTILGIAAATALITTMLAGVTSFFSFFGDMAVQEMGYWDGEFKNLTQEQVQELKQDPRIKNVSVADANIDITGIRVQSDASERMRVGNIIHLDSQFMENKILSEYEGTLPAAEDEVAVEEKYITDNNLNISVGDTITVELGNRFYYDPDGQKVVIGGNYNTNEEFETIENKSYKVTAILHGNRPTGSYDLVHYISGDSIPQTNYVDIRLKKLGFRSYEILKNIASDHNLHYDSLNTEYLISYFAFNKDSRGVASIVPVGMIALLIVIGTAVILIYNAFGMSLTERMRYLGMLASVGATKKQKRASIYFEALALGIIGIPFGMVLGYIGAFFTLSFLGGKMISSGTLVGAKEFASTVPVRMPFGVALFVIFISCLTIFISAFIPALKASKVMPIEALRQTNVIKVKARSLRINPVIKKIFGYEGELAYKNIKRNGVKGAVITISIAVSVTMFLTVMQFCGQVETVNNYDWDVPYQVSVTVAERDSERFEEALQSLHEVKDFFRNQFIQFEYREDPENPDHIPPNGDILNSDYLNSKYKKAFDSKVISVCTIPDEDFNELLLKNGIDPEPYFNGELKGVILNDYNRSGRKENVFNEGIIGQKLFYDEPEGNPPAITISEMVDYEKGNYIFNLVPKKCVVVYVPDSRYMKKAEEVMGDYATASYAIVTNDSEALCKELYGLMDTEEFHSYSIGDIEGSMATMKVVMLLLKTVMYGFTALITLIVLANMINTIYTGVIMRRKEFAMYRSVGMTEKGFKKMISLETILYALRALVVALPLSVVVYYLMCKKAYNLEQFHLNWGLYLVVIVVVVVIVGISMLMSISKVKNDEIIEVLKEDIC